MSTPGSAVHPSKDEPYDLRRFLEAQEDGATYDRALAELRAGSKRSHWMWFVFPQVAGLGHSATAQRYAIGGLPEARAYLAHPVLGDRLLEASRALVDLGVSDPVAVLGGIDAQKLRSSLTLFRRAVEDDDPRAEVFDAVLAAYFQGHEDEATLARLRPDRGG